MKFRRKSGVESKISTSSMPDIIFMLLIFFMVTTVLREFSGLPVSLPKAERIESGRRQASKRSRGSRKETGGGKEEQDDDSRE